MYSVMITMTMITDVTHALTHHYPLLGLAATCWRQFVSVRKYEHCEQHRPKEKMCDDVMLRGGGTEIDRIFDFLILQYILTIFMIFYDLFIFL